MYIEVLVEIKSKKIDKTFTYHVPSNFNVCVGIRVLVPFGKQKLEGFVLNITNEKPEYPVKDIIKVIDESPVINDEMLELGKYISKKTLSTLISAYQSMLPKALKAKNGFSVNKKYTTYLLLNDLTFVPKLAKQKEIIALFQNKKEVLKLDATKISLSSVKTLIDKNVLKEIKKETYRINTDNEICPPTIKLNSEQQTVVDKVLQNKHHFKPFLLYGVTGSGKTEVYMHIIDDILKQKKEVIVLVPEISLTPQMVSIFKKRFGSNVAILHSGLNDGEKYDEWRKIERQEVAIAIGARSAIFAPFKNLGLIIIDEEHTTTYKQENNPKYHAIDVALYRSKTHNCPLILGSATPTIESFTRAKTGVYELLTLPNRVNNNPPKVYLIDMKEEIKKGNHIISEMLKNKINDRINKHEQIILLLNRRGYTTITECKECGYIDKCPKCDIPLTFHKSCNKMKCHYCGYEKEKIFICPKCQCKDINSLGMGTEKLEQEINKMFKLARTIRMDIDTTKKRGAYEQIINDFKSEKYNILIGTQMISKGLDFKKVTLVGVINGDASLNIPDFRSSERTFQLLNQVSGRAGRADLPGIVIIQGFNITHYSILLASKHDYISFYNEEMRLRKLLGYPPFFNLTLIKIMAYDLKVCELESKKIATFLKANLPSDKILGPSLSSIPRINNTFYMQVIIKFKKTTEVIKALKLLMDIYKNNTKVNIEIDINPLKI